MSVCTRSSGESSSDVVVSTDCCSSESAERPQLFLKNCRDRKGKIEGKTHTYSQTNIWRRERGMSVTSEFLKKLEGAPGEESCSQEVLAGQRRQNKGIPWLRLLWHWSHL